MITVREIASLLNGEISGNPETDITGVCDLVHSEPGCISFLANPGYIRYLEQCRASAVIVDRQFTAENDSITTIRVPDPFLGFIQVLRLFDNKPVPIHAPAESGFISPDAECDPDVVIQPGAVIMAGVRIESGTIIGPGTVIGPNCRIGQNSELAANVTLYHSIAIGNHVHIDSGTVVGADGFGWYTKNGKHLKIPQTGSVVIHDGVWIGANCCIDRGTVSNTTIGAHSKIDNLIQIAHNVKIGEGCLIAGQCGIAGSSQIGDYVTLAGQVGVADHLKIGDKCIVASKSAVMQDLPAGSFVSGIPARKHQDRKRQDVVVGQLPELLRRLRRLEHRVKELEE